MIDRDCFAISVSRITQTTLQTAAAKANTRIDTFCGLIEMIFKASFFIAVFLKRLFRAPTTIVVANYTHLLSMVKFDLTPQIDK